MVIKDVNRNRYLDATAAFFGLGDGAFRLPAFETASKQLIGMRREMDTR